jgi:hypothetical protein
VDRTDTRAAAFELLERALECILIRL